MGMRVDGGQGTAKHRMSNGHPRSSLRMHRDTYYVLLTLDALETLHRLSIKRIYIPCNGNRGLDNTPPSMDRVRPPTSLKCNPRSC